MHPTDKVVFEERTYHKACLSEQLISDSNDQQTGFDDVQANSLKDLTEDKQHDVSTGDLDDASEDVLNDNAPDTLTSDTNDVSKDNHRVIIKVNSVDDKSLTTNDESSDKFYEVDEKLSLKSFDEKIDEESSSRRSGNLSTNDNQEDNQLKSVSSNLSSLNPFDDENDDDEFYEMESDHQRNQNLNNSTTVHKTGDLDEKTEIKACNADDKKYPKELNPFGSDEEDDDLEEIDKQQDKEMSKSITSNPFGDSESEAMKDTISTSSYVKVYPEALCPFDETDETIEEMNDNKLKPLEHIKSKQIPKNYSTSSLERFNHKQPHQSEFKSFSNLRPNRNSFNQNYDTLSIRSLTPDGKWKSNKKRAAPLPPNQQQNSSSVHTSLNTDASTTSSPVLIKKTNSESKDTIDQDTYHSSQSLSENSFVSLTNTDIDESKEHILKQKRRFKKDRPAPLPPTPLIRYVDSIEEIEKESDEIGDKLLVNSNSIREIEIKLKDNQTTKELSKSAVKKLVYEYLDLAEVKCGLDKRQIELSYMKCENKLEKDQVQVDLELRMLYEKDAKSKTFEDLKLEEDLLEKLIDIIERKNEIEENIVRIDKS